MTGRHHARQIQVVGPGELSQVVEAATDIEVRRGPAAAFVSHSPVLDAPDRESRVCHRLLGLTHVGEVEHRQPAPAVHECHHGMGTVTRGESEIAELKWMTPVCDAMVRLRRFEP